MSVTVDVPPTAEPDGEAPPATTIPKRQELTFTAECPHGRLSEWTVSRDDFVERFEHVCDCPTGPGERPT